MAPSRPPGAEAISYSLVEYSSNLRSSSSGQRSRVPVRGKAYYTGIVVRITARPGGRLPASCLAAAEIGSRSPRRILLAALLLPLLLPSLVLGQAPPPKPPAPVAATPGNFIDVTRKLGVHFKQEASPTSKKYLLEAMGSGVALFDYDNDGRLDIFFANGARIDDPMPVGAMPRKDGPQYWNRLYH